ncbi:MAG TPA: DNA-binding protein [Acidimicrobiia bacterium]
MEDLLTLADIGRMFSVTRQAAGKWAKAEDFPAPLGQTGTGRVWKRKDVERWARKVGRLT